MLPRYMLYKHVLSWNVVSRHVLFGYMAIWDVLSCWPVALLGARASAYALAEPQRAGSQHAAQLAGARQVPPVPRPQREVLVVAGDVAGIRAARGGEPVVRIRPCGGLLGIEAGGSDPRG